MQLYLVDSQLWVVTSGDATRQVASVASRATVNIPLDPGEVSHLQSKAKQVNYY